MNQKNVATISAEIILTTRSFDLDRRRRMIMRVMEYHKDSGNVPVNLLPLLNEALVETDWGHGWTERILARLKELNKGGVK